MVYFEIGPLKPFQERCIVHSLVTVRSKARWILFLGVVPPIFEIIRFYKKKKKKKETNSRMHRNNKCIRRRNVRSVRKRKSLSLIYVLVEHCTIFIHRVMQH
jgi:hypothetical protein